MAILVVDCLTKQYGPDVTALNRVCLDLERGAFLSVVGPSGAGKTTLLRLIAGLDSAGSGTIRIDAQDVTNRPPEQRGVAMVFQNTPLYPHMTVYQNMAFALKMAGVAKSEIRKRVQEAAQWLQIESLLRRKPGTLSAGQRQRVGIGKALVRQARITLLDEPLSHVDAPLRKQLRQRIRQYQTEHRLSFVWVTHDQAEAVLLADQLCVLHEGSVQQIGSPTEILQSPANALVSEFFMIDLMGVHKGTARPSAATDFASHEEAQKCTKNENLNDSQTILPTFSGHFSRRSAGHFCRWVLITKLQYNATVAPPQHFVFPLFHTLVEHRSYPLFQVIAVGIKQCKNEMAA